MALKLLDKVKLALSNSINDDKGWIRQGQFTPKKQIEPLIKTIQNYQQQVNQAKQTPFFNSNNTPTQWIGKVGQEFKNRGIGEGIHGLTNPITMNPYIRPITEEVVGNVRTANYKAGRPSHLLNIMLGQQDHQMADKGKSGKETYLEKLEKLFATQGLIKAQQFTQPAVSNVQAWANPQVRQQFNQAVIQPKINQITGPQPKGPLPTMAPLVSQGSLKNPLLDKLAEITGQSTRALINAVPSLVNSFSNKYVYDPKTKKMLPASRLRPENSRFSDAEQKLWIKGFKDKSVKSTKEWQEINKRFWDNSTEEGIRLAMAMALTKSQKMGKFDEKAVQENFNRMFGKGGSTVAVRNGSGAVIPNIPSTKLSLPPVSPIKTGGDRQLFRGDSTPIKLSDMDTTEVFKSGEKEALSAFNNTPGLYFTDSIDNAKSYGNNVTTISVKPNTNIINVNDAPKILKRSDVEKIIRSNPNIKDWATNWSENFDDAIKQITDSVMAEKDGNEFLKAIWSDGGFSPSDFTKAMKTFGIDGITVPKEGVNHFVIYNKESISQSPNISPIKTGGERTIKIKTGANLDNNQMGRTGNTLDQGKGQTQSISGKTPQGKPSPELPKQEQVVSRLSNPLGNQKSSSLTTSGNSTKNPTIKIRGFTESVQEAPKVTTGTKVKVIGEYTVKPTDELMGEAKALLTEGASIKDVKKVQNIDAKITATIQQAINLDKAGKHKEAAALFNNLSETGTELGRGVHAFTLLNQMSPEAISLSAAGKIKKYNETAKVKIPELTADQQKMISDNVKRIQSITDERMKNIELNKLQEKISNFIPSSFVDKLITTWKAGLLTSPRTTGRNIVGNTIMQGGEMTASKPAAFADWLMSQKTGQRTTVGSLQGTLSGAKTGVSSAVDVMKYGFDPSETITKFDIKKVTWGNNPVEQTLKKYTDFVFNSLSAQDKPFWNSSYARSLYDQAATTALNQGQKGNQKLIQSLVDNATEQMKTIATNDANYATFKDKNMISNIAAGFKRAAGQKEWSKLPAEIMAPFTGVPSSIVGKTIDYSPIGLIKGIKDAGKVVTQNVPDLQRRAAQEIGRGTVGTAVFALGSYLMSKGLMTGQAKDDAERKQWELEGKQQNSIFVNGKWRSINSVGPQTLILLAGAKFDEEMKDPEGSMSKYGLTLVQDQLGQTFLSGVQQPLQAITDPNRYGKSYVGGQVASFVPNIVKDTSKALDPLARETDTGSFMGNIKTSVQSGIPIWRNQMTPKRDVLGNEIKQEPTGLGAYIDLFNSKTPISNNVVDELSRLNNAGYNATPSKLSSTQTIKGVKGKLNQQELDVLETKTGIAVSNGLDTLFKSNSYQKLDDEAKQKAVDDLVTKIRKQVRGTIDLTVMPDMGYTISADSPKGLGKVGLYGKSIITDPGQTIKAVIAGNPIRKVDGGAVILERKNGLGTLDAGDKTTQVDHIIPLSHGGTNDKENLQQLSNEEHKIKTEFNNYWLKEFQAGRISKKELQEKDKNWKNEIDSLPQATKEKLVAELSTDTTGSGKNYQIINDETGSISNIDLTFPEYPKLTGLTEADKALKSSYYSALSKIKSNAKKLYDDGQLTAEEYNDILTKVSTSKSKSGSGKTKSKGGKITIKTGTTKFTPIKIKTYKPPTLKISKGIKKPSISSLKSRRTIKIKV